ncbi:MAG: hypothetical protein AAF693_15250 [Bacteroidota bacterium]
MIRKPGIKIDTRKYFYRIHLATLLLGIVLTLLLVALKINFFNYKKPIAYQNMSQISLKDFRGFNIPGRTLDGNDKFATITTSIEVSRNQDAFAVTSLFHPSRSYIYNRNAVSSDLLKHEMYHFHITEIFARELRKLLAEKGEQVDFKKKYDSILVEEKEMQKIYDYDSYHGYLLSKQKEWESKIDSILLILDDYKISK